MTSFGKRQKQSFFMHVQNKELSRKNSKLPLKSDSNDADTSMSQASPKGAASLNANEIAAQLEQVMKSYHLSHKPSKYVNSSVELETHTSPQTSMEFGDKVLMSYDEGKEGIGSSTNLSGNRTLVERSNTLISRKKVKELSILKTGKLNLNPIQEKSIPRGSMMLNRFIDGMILKGNLPMEANDLFSPTLKSPTLKSPSNKSPGLQSPRAKNIMTQVRLKPLPKKEINGSPTLRDTDLTQNIDIIPNWMSNLSDFSEKYNMIKMRARFPIYEILNRDDEYKGDLELNIVCKWLEKMDLFQRFPYDKLLELSKRLKTVFLREGQILCNIGDNADCLYIIYEGEIEVLISDGDSERIIIKAQSGEVLGRHTLETPGKRTAKLKATKPTYVVSLYRNDYQEVTGDLRNMIRPAQQIQSFLAEHSFLRQFTQVQQLSFMNHFEFRKHYKNDIIYNIGDASEKFYFLMEGEVTRELPITKESINKWPKGLKTWEMYKKAVTYSVKLPLECGEIFGLKEFLENKPREEKLITEGDALILSCSKKFFYDMFEQYEISIFEKRAEQDEKVKAEKLSSVFEISTKILKIKEDAMENIVKQKGIVKVGKNESQAIKVKEWQRAFTKFTTAAKTEKKVVDKKETHKTLASIYDC